MQLFFRLSTNALKETLFGNIKAFLSASEID
jgi:hypothetical protein